MPNATCFLVAYAIVLGLEFGRWVGLSPRGKAWLMKLLVAMTALALLTHTLYLLDRVFLSAAANQSWRLLSSWHDWGILSAWALAVAYAILLLRRSESWFGLFILPLLLVMLAGAIAIPSKPLGSGSSATLWRLVHGIAMTLGTMFVTLGFAMAGMYLVQAARLKAKRPSRGFLKLPSLEYLQTFGSYCLWLSTASIGFGVISGVVMNLVQDGQVNWLDRGTVFSGGLFFWLVTASLLQWQSAKRGKGHLTAWMNILSFVVVLIALYLVVSAPHGQDEASKKEEQSLAAPGIEAGGGK